MTTLVSVSSEPVAFHDGDEGEDVPFFRIRSTVISQYANSPVLLALLDALGSALDWKARVDAFYSLIWNVDSASGFGLDIWGRIVGVSRTLYVADGAFLGFSDSSDAHPFGEGIFWGAGRITSNYRLTDLAFRQVILAKAALNITDGSIPSINAILMALFPDYGNSFVRDDGAMSMTYVFGAPLSKVDYAIVTQSGVLPKPIGVAVAVEQP